MLCCYQEPEIPARRLCHHMPPSSRGKDSGYGHHGHIREWAQMSISSHSPQPLLSCTPVFICYFIPIKLELSPLCPQNRLPSTTALLKCLSLPFCSSCRHYSFDLPGFLPVPLVCFLFSLSYPWGMLTAISCSVGAQNINSYKCPQPHQLSCNRCHRSTETRSASR